MQLTQLFNLYGFIIGIAMVIAIYLIEKKAKKNKTPFDENIFFITIIFGIIGARLWHVATDFNVYTNNLISILYIWNGGLSILGGIAGGLLAIFFLVKKTQITFLTFTDLAVFGVPFGQAIGRLGNFFNQELYGLPTTLPWKIHIERQYRLPGFQQYEYYHPLFLYEMVLTVAFSIWLWWFDTNKKKKLIGTGLYTSMYIFYYSVVRFLLDFLRIDKAQLSYIGINQLILLVVAVYSGVQLVLICKKVKKVKINTI